MSLFETFGKVFNPKRLYIGITYQDIKTVLVVDEEQTNIDNIYFYKIPCTMIILASYTFNSLPERLDN